MLFHKKIVLLVLENRSFDNIYGYFNNEYANNIINYEKKTNNKLYNLDSKNQKIFAWKGLETQLKIDPGENHQNVLQQIGPIDSNGKYPMNGFVTNYEQVLALSAINSSEDGKTIMCSIDPKRIPVLSKLAETFILCDNWNCSEKTQTLTNRSYIHSGTAAGQMNNRPYLHWLTQKSRTLFDQMSENELSYSIYYDERDVLPLTWLIHYQSLRNKQKHFFHHSQLWEDFKTNNLPLYSFIEPRFLVAPSDYHPKDSSNLVPFHNSVQAGELFVSQVYNAWKNSPGRDEILLIITFDESGGVYEHVSPPINRGVRVPTLLISTHLSPESQKTHICSESLEHCSILKTIHEWLNLPNLTDVDRKANHISNSLFCADVSLSFNQLPNIESLFSMEDFKEKEELLFSLPIKNGVGENIVECIFSLCDEKKVETFKERPALEILNYLNARREEFNWFSHLEFSRKNIKRKKEISYEFPKAIFIFVGLLILVHIFQSIIGR